MIWNSVLRNMSADKKINGRVNGPANKKNGRRRRGRISAWLSALCVAVCVSGCAGTGGKLPSSSEDGPSGSGFNEGKISVVTTVFPPYDFVREIAGDEVELKMLLKPGEETHSYEPTPQDIIAIQNSDVFIYTGGENDVWVEDILSSMPESDMRTLRLADCVDTVEEEQVEGMKGAAEHDHGHEEESPHEIDEHVWTSPVNASLITEKIRDILSQADSSHSQIYEENARAYQEKLLELDREFREVTGHAQRKVLIFGDRFPFRYFADEYGLEYYAAFPGCSGDTEPSAATMAFLIEKVREEQVPAVLKMELSNADIANAVAEATGTEVKVLYSCHNLSADEFENGETYLTMMQKNVETLKEVLN